MDSARFRLTAALAAVYLIWGSTYLAIRFAIETIPPFLMSGSRFIVAGGTMYVVLRLSGAARPTPRQWWGAVVVGALLLLGGNGGVVWAVQHVPSGLAALLIATEPLWVLLVDWVRPGGVRPTRAEGFGLIVGFAGAALLISPAELIGGRYQVDPVGAAVLIFASISWAMGSVCSRYIPAPASPVLGTAMKMIAGGLLLGVVGLASGETGRLDISAVSAKSLAAMVYLIVFGAIVAFTAYIWLLKNTSLAMASTYAYVNPAVAVFLGWLIADEPITPRTVLAATIIVGGVLIITTSRATLGGRITNARPNARSDADSKNR
jgi:drug/metabolite transporter (DMT)-like permease